MALEMQLIVPITTGNRRAGDAGFFPLGSANLCCSHPVATAFTSALGPIWQVADGGARAAVDG